MTVPCPRCGEEKDIDRRICERCEKTDKWMTKIFTHMGVTIVAFGCVTLLLKGEYIAVIAIVAILAVSKSVHPSL